MNQKSQDAVIKTLLEINRAYPQVRNRVKDITQWKALSKIEQEINKAALKDDLEGVNKVLEAYKRAVLTITEGTGSQGVLFQVTTIKGSLKPPFNKLKFANSGTRREYYGPPPFGPLPQGG
jgi:hypothetical protein